MDLLAEEGWLCGSRRHIGGAGDILAIRTSGKPWDLDFVEAILIEVKSTTRSAWVAFGPADRQELVETAQRFGAEAWLYWWAPRKSLQRIHYSQFPANKAAAA